MPDLERIKEAICSAIMEKESPAQIVKTCLDAFCMMSHAFGLDINEIYEKWQEGKEVK